MAELSFHLERDLDDVLADLDLGRASERLCEPAPPDALTPWALDTRALP